MKRAAMVLALATACLAAHSVLWAQDADEAPTKEKKVRRKAARKDRKPRLPGELGAMVKVCSLTEEQQKKVSEISAAGAKAAREWQKANAENLKAAREKMRAARQAKEKDAVKKAGEEMKALNAQRAEISAKTNADILAVLTEQQRAAWQSHLDVRAAVRGFRKAKLTEDQTAKVKEITDAHMKDVDRNDKKAVGAAMKKIADAIRADVLTDEQREATKPKARPRRQKPERTE